MPDFDIGRLVNYGGTAPKFCMFHKRCCLPLPPVEHTKLRSCTSVRKMGLAIERTWDRRPRRSTNMGSKDWLGASWKNETCETGSLAHLLSPVFFVTCVKWSAFGECNHGKSQSSRRFSRISEKSNSFQSRFCCSSSHPHLLHTGSLIASVKETSPPHRLSRSSRFSHPHCPQTGPPPGSVLYYSSTIFSVHTHIRT